VSAITKSSISSAGQSFEAKEVKATCDPAEDGLVRGPLQIDDADVSSCAGFRLPD
jgi:hypothetical protein